MRPPLPDLAVQRFEVLHDSEGVAVLRWRARWSAEPPGPACAPELVVDDGSREHRFAARLDPGCDPTAPLWRASCRVPSALARAPRTAYALAFGPRGLVDLPPPRVVPGGDAPPRPENPAAAPRPEDRPAAPAPAARPLPPRRSRALLAASGLALAGAAFTWPAVGSGTASPPPGPLEPLTGLAVLPRAPLPAAHVPHRRLYEAAARRYGLRWALLAAVGDVETRHGRARLPGVRAGTSAGGAAGLAQFTPSTWAAYGHDAGGDGRIDVYDPRDAIPSMAAFLRAHGAPRDEARALFAYNASRAYVQRVLARARRYAAAG